jgi:hypothetical protein
LGDHEIVYIDTDISAKLNKPVKRKIYMGDFQKNEDFSFSENNLNIK